MKRSLHGPLMHRLFGALLIIFGFAAIAYASVTVPLTINPSTGALQSHQGTYALDLNSSDQWQFTGADVVPSANNADSLGSSTSKWKNLYVAGTATIGTMSLANLDGTIIGATTPAAGTFTTLTATGALTTGNISAYNALTNGNLTINAKGTGTIGIGDVSTGAVTITPTTELVNGLTTDAVDAKTTGDVLHIGEAIATGGLALGSATVATTVGGTLSVTGQSTFATSTATDDELQLVPHAGGAARFTGKFTTDDLTADRTYTFPDTNLTVAGLGVAETFTNIQTFTNLAGPSLVVGGNAQGAVNLGDGAVTQATNINTGVTINAASGVITTQSASTAAATVETGFTVTDSAVAAGSVIHATISDYSGTYFTNGFPVVLVDNVANGSFHLRIANQHAANALSGTMKIHFTVE